MDLNLILSSEGASPNVSKDGHKDGVRGHPSTRAAFQAARLRMRLLSRRFRGNERESA